MLATDARSCSSIAAPSRHPLQNIYDSWNTVAAPHCTSPVFVPNLLRTSLVPPPYFLHTFPALIRPMIHPSRAPYTEIALLIPDRGVGNRFLYCSKRWLEMTIYNDDRLW